MLALQRASILLVTNSIFSITGPSTTTRHHFFHFLQRTGQHGPRLRVIVVTNGRSSTTHLRTPVPLLRRLGASVMKTIPQASLYGVSFSSLLVPLCGGRKGQRTVYLTIPCLHRKSCPTSGRKGSACIRNIAQVCHRLCSCTSDRERPNRTLLTVKRLRTANTRLSRSSQDRQAVVKKLRSVSMRTFGRSLTCATLNRVRGTRQMKKHRSMHCTNDPLPVSFSRRRCRRRIITFALRGKYLSSLRTIPVPLQATLRQVPTRPTSPTRILLSLSGLPLTRRKTSHDL